MTIKTFRGLLADGEQLEINLRTNKGNIGYRINKFELFPHQPGQQTVENTVQVFKSKQAGTISTTAVVINFGDQDLLAAGTFHESHGDNLVTKFFTVFEREVFNQNIYVTHTDTIGTVACNFYLELEQVKLSDNESTMATLQSIRSRYEAYTPAGPT